MYTDGFVEYMQQLARNLSQGDVHGRLLFACRAQPLRKKDGSICVVHVPELILRVTIKCAIRFLVPDWKETLSQSHFDPGTQRGSAFVRRAVELAALEPDSELGGYTEISQVHFVDAFSMMDRDLIAEQVRMCMPQLYKLLLSVYGKPAVLVVNGRRRRQSDAGDMLNQLAGRLDAFMRLSGTESRTGDADRSTTARRLADHMFGEQQWTSAELLSHQGVHRGDPLATVLVSLSMCAFTEVLQGRLSPAHLVFGYMDSIVVLSRADHTLPETTGRHVLEVAARIGAEWRRHAPQGLVLDTAKSRVFTRSDAVHGDGIPLFGNLVGSAEVRKRLGAGLRTQAESSELSE